MSCAKRRWQRKQPLGYDGHCLHLQQDEIAQRLANNEPHVVRMNVPREGQCAFNDMLRGEISIEWSQIDLQVLSKSRRYADLSSGQCGR